MNESVIIIGAGGHGRVIADIVLKSGDTLLGFLDDGAVSSEISGIPVLGRIEDYVKYPDTAFIIGIGSSAARESIAQRLGSVRWHTAIHPSAVISALDTHIGPGSAVMANAVVGPGARIGSHCIVNTAAVVEHDNRIGDYVHVSVGARLGGTVTVGEHTWVGIGAVISNNVAVCPHCMLGAGAVVIHDIRESGTYVGVPAGKIK